MVYGNPVIHGCYLYGQVSDSQDIPVRYLKLPEDNKAILNIETHNALVEPPFTKIRL